MEERKLKILVLADNFVPELVATSFRTHEHGVVWLEEGHEVTVVTCAPNWPKGQVFSGYKNRLYQEEWIDGIRVIRVWSYIAENRGVFKRTMDYVSYMVVVVLFCWRFPRFDVVLATSPQFFTAVAGYLVATLRRRPWVFELRDLWPDSVRAVGASSSRVLKLFEALELFLYRKARRVIALTRPFRENLKSRGIEADKIDVIPNGVDAKRFGPQMVEYCARERLGIGKDKFLVGYIGTVGMASGLEALLDAAEKCRDDEIHFLVVGQGACRSSLEEAARSRGIANVTFSDSVPHDEVPSFYGALDVSLVHLRPDPLFTTVIPSKIFEAMAMGCPLLVAVEGEATRITEEAEAGVCVAGGDGDALLATIERMRSDPESLAQWGRNGRAAAEREHSRRARAKEVSAVLERVVEGT